jgi:hypothetical protein
MRIAFARSSIALFQTTSLRNQAMKNLRVDLHR